MSGAVLEGTTLKGVTANILLLRHRRIIYIRRPRSATPPMVPPAMTPMDGGGETLSFDADRVGTMAVLVDETVDMTGGRDVVIAVVAVITLLTCAVSREY